MGLRQFMSGMALVILFGISLSMFMFGVIDQNNPSYDTSEFNSSELQERADELEELGESSKTILMGRSEPSPVYVFLVVYSALAIPLGFVLFLSKSIGTVLTLIWTPIFGVGSSDFDIVFGLISGLLLLTVIIFIMRAIRTGETEK